MCTDKYEQPSDEGLTLFISDHSAIHVYLQIARQITYLIYSRRLEDEARLPTVRALAQQLGVHPNTVVQAYAELRSAGLIDTFRGRGTFVRPLSIIRDADWEQRQQLLQGEVERMRHRVHALGFTDEDMLTQVSGVIQTSEAVSPCLFVAPSLGAHKYAAMLSAELAPYRVVVTPLEYEHLLQQTPEAWERLSESYFVLTPVSLKQQVEDLLVWHETHHGVLGITLEITETTAADLAALGTDQNLCVFTSERYLPIALNILSTYGTAPLTTVSRVLDTTPLEQARAAFEAADVVIHTYGVGPLLEDSGVPDSKLMPLEFRADSDSLSRLRDLFADRAVDRPIPGTSE